MIHFPTLLSLRHGWAVYGDGSLLLAVRAAPNSACPICIGGAVSYGSSLIDHTNKSKHCAAFAAILWQR